LFKKNRVNLGRGERKSIKKSVGGGKGKIGGQGKIDSRGIVTKLGDF